MGLDETSIGSLVLLLLFGVALIGAVKALARGDRRKRRDGVCTRCLSQSGTRQHTPGSTVIELALWLCFIVPGLIYSLWRVSARREVCAECGASEMVPASSPAARRLLGYGETD